MYLQAAIWVLACLVLELSIVQAVLRYGPPFAVFALQGFGRQRAVEADRPTGRVLPLPVPTGAIVPRATPAAK